MVRSGGYMGVAFLMAVEHLFPPIPSELVMPLAGYEAEIGDLHLGWVIVFGSFGSLVGTSAWYVAGRMVGEPRLRRWIARHGRWLTMSTEDLDRGKDWIQRHGAAAVFVCRLIPGLRTVVSLPAGFSGMPVPRFLFYSSLGTVLWTSILAYTGKLLGENYETVQDYVGPVSWMVLAGAAAVYLWRMFRPEKGHQPEDGHKS